MSEELGQPTKSHNPEGLGTTGFAQTPIIDEVKAPEPEKKTFPPHFKNACIFALVAILLIFSRSLFDTAKVWISKADYSHGFIIPIFSAYLIWRNREYITASRRWPKLEGLLFFALAGIGLAAASLNIAKETCQGLSLILALIGFVVMFFGWRGLTWSWPALVFLIFMFPLPYSFEQNLAFKLRRLATVVANYFMQTFGQPSYIAGTGTVITVGEVRLDVQHACSGLTMLLTFIALSAGYAALTNRSWVDKLLILLVAVPIAVICNVIRIVVTGHVYVWGWKKFGDLIVHDLAGWLMMPLALAMIWVLLKIVDWIAVIPIRIRKEEFMKANLVKDAYIRVRREKPDDPIAPHIKSQAQGG
jgi:exosortase